MQGTKRIPYVLSSLRSNTHILSKSTHLLMKVNVALLSLRGDSIHLSI